MDLHERFERRVREEAVAEVLECIATAPNRRERPVAGDIQGPFGFWFDGGAAKIETGYIEYLLADGTKAVVGACVPALSVTIEFPSGCRVSVQQET